MTERASRNRLPAKTPAGLFSLASRIQSDRRRRRRGRRRRPLFFSADTGGERGKKSIPGTPLLQWKFDEGGSQGGQPQLDTSGEALRKHRKPAASARRLAARIWHLRIPKVVGRGEMRLDFELEASSSLLPLPSSTEKTTKWDLGYSKVSKDAFGLYDNLKLLEDQKTNNFSDVSALRSELELAQCKISELEAERRSAKKKLDHFIRKMEEKAAWRRREHEKIKSVIDALKEDLNRERKNAQRLEIMNGKLVNELTDSKFSAKQLLQEYEKERKARELMEEVCHELAKELAGEKAEVEALKMESVKTQEEVEEERKMLQMAEVWREERVQMKLIDAKLALEEKYSKLSKLQEDIKTFLSLRSGKNYDASETAQAKALKEAVGSAMALDMKEFSYQPPPASDGIFSIFEELQPRCQSNVKEIEQCHRSVIPVANGFSENAMKRYDNMMFYGNCDAEEDDSGWETVSHVEELDSSKSPDGSDSEPSVSGVYKESRASISGVNCDDEKYNSEISEVCSETTRQSRKKDSLRVINADDFKEISFEVNNGRKSFNAAASPARKSAETGLSSATVGNWYSPDLLNSQTTNGMKGRVEWPQQHTKKESLKTKLMEARIQNQKVQLRQVLRQKI